MFEILTVIVLLLLAFCLLIIAPILLVIKVAQSIFGSAVEEVLGTEEVREHNWRQADAFERERMVRKACCWHLLGLVAGASAMVTGAFVAGSPALGLACCMAAWRILKPIKQEMRDACAYRSTGAEDEPRY
jgi:hypothetical protein